MLVGLSRSSDHRCFGLRLGSVGESANIARGRERSKNEQATRASKSIFPPLDTFEGKPTERGQADGPEQSHAHHRLLFTKLLRILQLECK